MFKSNNYLCRCVRVGWGRFRASTRLVKWSHFKARARAATPGKCGYIKEHEHYTIYFLPKNQKDSVKSQKDSVSPRFSEKTQKMHTIKDVCKKLRKQANFEISRLHMLKCELHQFYLMWEGSSWDSSSWDDLFSIRLIIKPFKMEFFS